MDDPILARMKREREEIRERRAAKLDAQQDHEQKVELSGEGRIVNIIQQQHDEFVRTQKEENQMKARQKTHAAILESSRLEEGRKMNVRLQAQAKAREDAERQIQSERRSEEQRAEYGKVQKEAAIRRNKQQAEKMKTDAQESERAANAQIQQDKLAALKEIKEREEVQQRLADLQLERERVAQNRQQHTKAQAAKRLAEEKKQREEKRLSQMNTLLRKRVSLFEQTTVSN